MDSITYQLVLHNPAGRSVPATLSYHFQELKQQLGHEGLAALAETVGDSTEFTAFEVKGTFSAPLLTGPIPLDITGVTYVSMLGPTLATLFTGNAALASIGMEFNQIDSPGNYIGGGISWLPEGPGGGMQPWCLIGTRQE